MQIWEHPGQCWRISLCFNKRAMRRASLSRTSQYWVTYIPFMISMYFLCQMWDNKVEANNVRQRHMFQQKALLLSSCTPPAVSSHHNANAPYHMYTHSIHNTALYTAMQSTCLSVWCILYIAIMRLTCQTSPVASYVARITFHMEKNTEIECHERQCGQCV